MVDQAGRGVLPHRHTHQEEYTVEGDRGTGAAGRQLAPLRSHRLSAGAPVLHPQKPPAKRRSRGPRQDRYGKILRILTNDLDAIAQEIADLYKSRWLIELFFRWIKQNLKIRHL